jgi:hypothetical protein
MLLAAVFLLASALPAVSDAVESPLTWANSVRRAAGVAPVIQDELLARTAQGWAAALAASGVLSHRGADGSSVLDRYRAHGGTEARVGEIIGAGPDLAAVERGWAASPDHRRLTEDPAWTHVGWGVVSTGTSEVWVVVFCQKLVDDLKLDLTGGGLVVSGAFVPGGAMQAVFFDGLSPMAPDAWDPSTRRFSFTVPDTTGYFRLGYVSAGGAFQLTNAFTLPPGKGSPGGPDHSAAPGRQP